MGFLVIICLLIIFLFYLFIYLFFSCLGKEAGSDLGKCEERYGDVSIHFDYENQYGKTHFIYSFEIRFFMKMTYRGDLFCFHDIPWFKRIKKQL